MKYALFLSLLISCSTFGQVFNPKNTYAVNGYAPLQDTIYEWIYNKDGTFSKDYSHIWVKQSASGSRTSAAWVTIQHQVDALQKRVDSLIKALTQAPPRERHAIIEAGISTGSFLDNPQWQAHVKDDILPAKDTSNHPSGSGIYIYSDLGPYGPVICPSHSTKTLPCRPWQIWCRITAPKKMPRKKPAKLKKIDPIAY